MSLLLFAALMQVASPVIDPILEPRRDDPRGEIAAPAPPSTTGRLSRCVELAESDPGAAIAEGARWLLADGAADAELCLGIAYSSAERWGEAIEAFDRGAAGEGGGRRQALLAQAAVAVLASGDAQGAKARLDTLLADPSLPDGARGDILIDRARTSVALGDGPAAQADLTAAQVLLPNDPQVWLLSATLARRQGALDPAGDFIDRALELDQSDPAILLEAGNIAIQLNAYGVAREAWQRALVLSPESDAGQAASRNLERLDEITGEEGTLPVELPEVGPAEPQN